MYSSGVLIAGHTASLVSKYRPAMPILTLVIPQLKTEAMKWRLEGRAVARQCQISRSLFPVLAAPSPSGTSPQPPPQPPLPCGPPPPCTHLALSLSCTLLLLVLQQIPSYTPGGRLNNQ